MKTFVVGATCLGVGSLVGFSVCKRIIRGMLTDREYIYEKIIPVIEEAIGEDKLMKINAILNETELIKEDF